MNLHNICLNCSNELKYIGKKYIKNELGFKIPHDVYQCSNCGKYFIICQNCDGNGFEDEYEDCAECHGFGKIQISENLLFELK